LRIFYPANIRFPMERANGLQIVRTCHALAVRGHEVHLAVRGGPGSDAEALDFYGLVPVPGLRLHRLPVLDTQWSDRLWNRSFDAGAVLLGVRLALLGGVKTVFLRDLGLARAFLALRPLLGLQVYYEVHQVAHRVLREVPALYGTASQTPARLERLEALERQVFSEVDGLAVLTRPLERAVRELGSPRGPVAVVPDAVDLDAFQGVPRTPSGPLTVGYMGQLYPWKGVDVLLKALVHAPAWRGLIVGGMPQEPADRLRLEALARALGLEGRVTFRPFVPPREVPAIYREVDAAALSLPDTVMGREYTSPLKLFEAMAAGCPVVASDLPALREVIKDGETALLVPPGDAAALAAALERLGTDGGLRRRLGEAARREAAGHSWDARAARLEALFA
jgi:glycosyltransferase involved in cell wall biosynthesis